MKANSIGKSFAIDKVTAKHVSIKDERILPYQVYGQLYNYPRVEKSKNIDMVDWKQEQFNSGQTEFTA